MKSILVVIIAVVAALLVIGGAVAYAAMSMEFDDSTHIGHAMSKIKEKLTGKSSSEGSSSTGSVVEKVGSVVKEEIVESGQNPGKVYREVTYSDGGVRQYDNDTGALVGSTYASDQDKLPSVE